MTPKGARLETQGILARDWAQGLGEAALWELGLNPTQLLPVVMETASTGKVGGRRLPANDVRDPGPQIAPSLQRTSAPSLCSPP